MRVAPISEVWSEFASPPEVALDPKGHPAYAFNRLTKPANVLVMPAIHSAAISTKLVQALGGAGFLNDSVVSRLFRDAKLMEIGAGTSEIRRMLIGRELLGAK